MEYYDFIKKKKKKIGIGLTFYIKQSSCLITALLQRSNWDVTFGTLKHLSIMIMRGQS